LKLFETWIGVREEGVGREEVGRREEDQGSRRVITT
jgi:hypothetical protein